MQPARARSSVLVASLALALVSLVPGGAAGGPKKKERMPAAAAPSYDFDAEFVDGDMMGATPGGAKDIGFFRDRVAAGEVPHPNVFTPEGLFSEHDLPLRPIRPCETLLCVTGEAVEGRLLVQPEVRYLAQLGFMSNMTPATFKRAPLNLIAVIDKSGSMSGQPLDLVKESLLQVVSQLAPDDQLAIVLYGDRSYVHMRTTSARRKQEIVRAIGAIESAGSTDMESGLRVGFDLAHRTAGEFKGTTRVMLFTDERPNVGRTDAQSFMGMAEAASKGGIGMTTVGVGVQFGAELATKVSSVRGGNLFFFADLEKMKKTFTEDFDTLVTELAYDLELEVKPADGLKIAGVYGIPGEVLEWTDAGAIRLHVLTIFLSKRKGAIYVALAAAGSDALPERRVDVGLPVASASLAYTLRGGQHVGDRVELRRASAVSASIGLQRGLLLVNEVTALKSATALHHEKNDQEGAYQIVHALASIYRQTKDDDLDSERLLVTQLEGTLAKLSGHQGEPGPGAVPAVQQVAVDPVTGLPGR